MVDVHLVVLRPRGAANLGSIARVMKNFALRRLTLVEPKIGSWNDAWMMAVHADDVLRETESVPHLDQALADARWIVGTSIRPLPGQRVLTPPEVAAEARRRGGLTLLFGDEESGLRNNELLRCHDVSMIPVSPQQPSLNLAQAVLVYAWELFSAGDPALPILDAQPAPDALLVHLEHALRAWLTSSRFADLDRPGQGVAELMQVLRRAHLTEDEARLWLVALKKSTRR